MGRRAIRSELTTRSQSSAIAAGLQLHRPASAPCADRTIGSPLSSGSRGNAALRGQSPDAPAAEIHFVLTCAPRVRLLCWHVGHRWHSAGELIQSMRMPIWLHLCLLIGGQILGCFLLPLTVLMFHKRLEAMGINFVLPAFVAFVFGYFAPRALLKFAIAARCPKCGGPADFHGGQPMTYQCRICGHVHRTAVFEGGRRLK